MQFQTTNNLFIQLFNWYFRDESLNMHWFLALKDGYEQINAWINNYYNNFRLHSSFNDLTPAEFIQQLQAKDGKTISLSVASVTEVMYFAAENNPAE